MVVQNCTTNFAERIESEATEIRMLLARTTQLWAAVDHAEHREDHEIDMTLSASVDQVSLLAEDADGGNAAGGDEAESGEADDGAEMESVETALESVARRGSDGLCSDAMKRSMESIDSLDAQLDGSLLGSEDVVEADYDMRSEGSRDSEGFDMDSDETASESGRLQLEERGGIADASNRLINVSKARYMQRVMLRNLIRLRFREDVTRAALEAGAIEIEQHCDLDCEMAYVDIFMSLVKTVCDAHTDVMNKSGEVERKRASRDGGDEQGDIADAELTCGTEQQCVLPFKWPVFDMAQFEYESARLGTCLHSVCVLTNLPKVVQDRTDELMEVLSRNLFCMIGDPIQVVIPSASDTECTKGHAFLEFEHPAVAQRCAVAVDGLTWGRGPFGTIRGSLFRQYQAAVYTAEHQCVRTTNDDETSRPRFDTDVRQPVALSYATSATPTSLEHERLWSSFYETRQDLLCDLDEDSDDTDEWAICRQQERVQLRSSSLLDLSSSSIDIRKQNESDQYSMQLSWDDETSDGGDTMQQQSQAKSDDEYDEEVDRNVVPEFQGSDEETFMDQLTINEPVHEWMFSDARCLQPQVSFSSDEVQEASLTVTSTASATESEAYADCITVDHAGDVLDDSGGVDNSWQRCRDDMIVRNREMQEQLSFARRRIVQLRQNNQKLHLLLDCMERDRDGLLSENDLLQERLNGCEDSTLR